MADALKTVNRFRELMYQHNDLQGAAQLVTAQVRFVGPISQYEVPAAEFLARLQRVTAVQIETRVLQQFQNGDDEACSVDESVLRTPAGGTILLSVANWYRLRQGKIAEMRIYYDPRDFLATFTPPAPKS